MADHPTVPLKEAAFLNANDRWQRATGNKAYLKKAIALGRTRILSPDEASVLGLPFGTVWSEELAQKARGLQAATGGNEGPPETAAASKTEKGRPPLDDGSAAANSQESTGLDKSDLPAEPEPQDPEEELPPTRDDHPKLPPGDPPAPTPDPQPPGAPVEEEPPPSAPTPEPAQPAVEPAAPAGPDPLTLYVANTIAGLHGGLIVLAGTWGGREPIPFSEEDQAQATQLWAGALVRYLPAMQTNHPELFMLALMTASGIGARLQTPPLEQPHHDELEGPEPAEFDDDGNDEPEPPPKVVRKTPSVSGLMA